MIENRIAQILLGAKADAFEELWDCCPNVELAFRASISSESSSGFGHKPRKRDQLILPR